MSESHLQMQCINCNAVISKEMKYCSTCGQEAHPHRLNGKHILHELTHAFTHADKNIFVLAWQLLYRPGEIAREYIQGKRKKYFNPITFIVLVVGFSSLIMYSSGFVDFSAGMGKNAFSDFLNKHTNIIIFLNIPILAFFNKLYFPKAGYNFWEHVIFVCFVSGQRSIFFSLVVAPSFILMPAAYNTILSTYLVAWIIYFSFADQQFLKTETKAPFLKCILVPVTNQIVMIIIVASIIFMYRLLT
jgi:hypothetical protein